MEHPDLLKQRLRADSRWSDAEADDILKRASEIESQTLFSPDGLSGAELERGANRAGISDAALQAAIKERERQKQIEAETARQKLQNRAKTKKRLAIGGAITAGALGLSLWIAQSALSSRLSIADAQNAQVETVLQRRADLIPNALAYARANLETDRELIRALENAQKSGAQTSLAPNSELNRILQRRAANGVQLGVVDELAGAENRIAVERRKYNFAASEYNRVARTFPASLWRSVLGFPAQKPLFKAEPGAKNAPRF